MANQALSTPFAGVEDAIVALANSGTRARQAIEDHIEWLISFLDRQDGDENLEPYLAGFDDHLPYDDREEENEHGGDIQDEPHDDGACTGPDYEHSLGWANPRFPGEVGNPANPGSYLPAGWACADNDH